MYIYRLAHALGDMGHESDVIHCTDSYHLLHPSEPPIKFAEHPLVKRHELRSSYKWLSPLLTQQTGRSFMKRKAMRNVFASKEYDVIHYHNISLLGPEVLTFEPSGKSAVKIYTTHEHWLICPTHVLWKFGERACEKPDCLRCTIKARRPPQLWRYTNHLKETGSYVDQFVSPSRFTANMHKERGFPYPVAHLPYFIERADEDWQKPSQRPHENPYFLFVGRLEVIKGLQTLIKVWERITDYDLLVAGTGDYEQQLREQAEDNPRIKFLGALSQKELGSLYFHAIASIVPSITYETFGMIIIESFARKTPVIVRDLGALPEVVNESNGGFVYQTDNELLEAVERISASPVLRSQLGENGYRVFVQNWSKEAHVKLYFDFLERTATRKFNKIPWKTNTDTPPPNMSSHQASV